MKLPDDTRELKIKGLNLQARGIDILQKGRVLPFAARTLDDMMPVLMDSGFAGDKDKTCYRMYRFPPHRNGIRFDLTVFSPQMLGKEYNKTFGHYHSPAPSGPTYAEIYRVLSGKACMILQKRLGKKINRVAAIEMTEGEAIIVPPGYGHVTSNRGCTVLVMSDLMLDGPKSDYSEYKKLHGAAYYDTKGGLVANPCYGKLPEPARVKASCFEEIYGAFFSAPEKFGFLKRPELTADVYSLLELKSIEK
jgi:glucose-6-phosphate isomerase